MRRRHFVIGLVLVAIATLLYLPLPASLRLKAAVRENIAPFQGAVSRVVQGFQDLVHGLTEAHRLREQLRGQEEELTALRFELRRWKGLAAEAEELRAQLGFQRSSPLRLVMCRVIARGDATGWWQTLRLDRGRESAIAPSMAVVTRDGLVGRVTTVSARSCDVLLVTDPNCRVSCRIPRTGGFGILEGTGVTLHGEGALEMLSPAGPCRLDFVSRDQRILEGYEVVTSGLGGVFPEGLLVGHVVRAGVDASGLYQQAEVRPAAPLDLLRYVFVVTGTEGGAR